MNMTARKIILALALIAIIAIPTATLRAQSNGEQSAAQTARQGEGILDVLEQIEQAKAQRLEGSWAFTVTLALHPDAPPSAPFQAYATIARGGAYIGSDRKHPFDSPQHGTWAHIRGDEFATTFIQDQFDVTGNFVGTFKVRQKITLIGKDEFVGVATCEMRDAAGNIFFTCSATTRGERIVIEPLTPQFQNITQPQ